jgi:hypothetical protein
MKKDDILNLPDGWEIKTLNQISDNLDSKRVPINKNKIADFMSRKKSILQKAFN